VWRPFFGAVEIGPDMHDYSDNESRLGTNTQDLNTKNELDTGNSGTTTGTLTYNHVVNTKVTFKKGTQINLPRRKKILPVM